MMLKLIYRFWPKVLRSLEFLHFHKGRQKFHVGFLKKNINIKIIKNYLEKKGYELAILAWKDKGEILNMRKRDRKIFQYHIRIFGDGEVCAHYEYTPEDKPVSHTLEKNFVSRKKYFKSLMFKFLV